MSCDRLRLASHVRACDCGGSVILLDLRRGRYLGVSDSVSRMLASQVDGWPVRNDPVNTAAQHDAMSAATQGLMSQGILTKEWVDQGPTSRLEEASLSIDASTPPTSRLPSAGSSLQFATSVAVAAWWLRCRSLQAVTSSITARRDHLLTPEAESLEAMRPRVAAYEALRPFFFTAREKCLLDSLALIMFLAKDGLLPRWVIGIKTNPFGAHAWVQCGSTVLNDQHEYVRQFRPILVV
jgi:Transglutaminase-like superfamily